MRTFTLLLALGLLSGCGVRERLAQVPAGSPCESSAQCPIDYTCVGCEEQQEPTCIQGCTTDADCSEGTCEQVECVTCPCPGRCAP